MDFENLFTTMGYSAFIQPCNILEYLFAKPVICRNNVGILNIVLGHILISFLIILPDLLWRVPVFIVKTFPQLGIDPRVVGKNFIQFTLFSVMTIPVGFIYFFAWTINWIFDWK